MASRSTSAMGHIGGGGGAGVGAREKTYFEQQREALIGEIAMSFEHVLANINKLNRSLEAVVAVGNEFSSVEALWSQFENVMAKDGDEGKTAAAEGEGQHTQGQGQAQTHGRGGDEGEGGETTTARQGE
ncbi:Uu.00g069370.m01.CDS01 [Anthostomella pinea]|uniref:DASH complex subunit DAD1 n=1 Tax=Anthostomella pinea TaxID=933095 RepID=A0AAI8YL60_9PEZI|nr:Uu.00g069370.m01.CDS01 [Anthostomella pinea]